MSKKEINSFIYNTTLIAPIEDILQKLKDNNFRDCDINWLNEKLEKFTKFALKTINDDRLPTPPKQMILNKLVKDKYIKYFTTLLDYFKSIVD